MASEINTNMESYYIEQEWIKNNQINPNMFLYYDKIYILKLSKPNKTFIGTLVSIEDNICNFSHIDNDETLSLIYENNEELSSMILLDEYKNKDHGYKIDEIYIVDNFNPVKSDYDDYEEVFFVEEELKKKNSSNKIIKEDLLSYLIRESGAIDNHLKINNIRILTDELFVLINKKEEPLLERLEWLQYPVPNLFPKAFIPMVDLKRTYLEVGLFGNQVELENFIDLCNNSKDTYKDVLKLYNSWLTRFINNDKSINEYNGIGYLSTDDHEQIKIFNDDISISSLIEIPIDKILYFDDMTLLEKKICGDIFYNNITNINTYNKHILSGNNWKENIENLRNIFSNMEDFIDNFLGYTEISDYMLNMKDVEYILEKYGMKIYKLKKTERNKIYKKIEDNCKKYISNIPKYKPKNFKFSKKSNIDNTKKVKLAKKYIFAQVQDYNSKLLLKKFIDVYTRSSDKATESNLWYYNIFNDEKLLCKHYKYYVEINNSNNAFNTMIDRFGSDPIDGCIFCKNCGEYLCLEEFSSLSGFKDDEPISQTAVIASKDDNFEILNDTNNDKILALVDFFSELLNISIDDDIKVNIIDIYLYIDSKTLSNIRYSDNDISTKPIHPRIKKEIDLINNEIKKTKKKSVKKDLEQDKAEIFEDFQLWLHDTNRFISILLILLLVNQTASLSINKKFEILNVETREINNKLISYIILKIIKNLKFINDKRLDYIKLLIKDDDLDCNNFERQLINSLNHIKTIPIILKKYEEYIKLLDTQKHNYIREEWVNYKPLHNNILISDVRKLINLNLQEEFLLKKYGNYTVQNISLIRPITQITSIADLCKIPRLEIIQNSSFIQFFRTCISCYGIHPPNQFINLLVENMINTLENVSIKDLFKKYKFNGGFSKLNFNIFRNKLIPDILKLYPNKNDNYIIHSCFDDEDTCNELIHTSINTYDLPLLNTYPKRHYIYNILTVIPDKNYDYYLKYNDDNPDNKYELIEKIFDKYGYNSVNDIEVKNKFNVISQNKIFKDVETIYKPVAINSDNFKMLLNIKSVFPKIPEHIYPPVINRLDDRLDQLLLLPLNSNENIGYLKNGIQAIFEDKSNKFIGEQLKAAFSDMIANINETIEHIAKYLTGCRWIMNEQITKFTKLIDKEFNNQNIQQFLMKFIMDREYTNEYIKLDINRMRYIFVNIISNNSYEFPKEWKLTDTIKSKFSEWMIRSSGDVNGGGYQDIKTSLLLHDRIFLYGSSDNYPGFNQYLNSKHIHLLFNKILDIFNNLDDLMGDDNTYYTVLYSNIMYKNILIEIFYLIVKYIEDLRETSSDISDDANELFIQLNISEEEFKQEGIDVISRFLMDLLNNLLLSHYDPGWIYQNRTKEELNKRLSKQREREKLVHLSRLTDVTKDQRFIADQKQKLGLSNMWKQGALDCEKFVNSEEAALLNESERKEKLAEILEDNGVTPDDFQMINLGRDLSNDQYELEEGYDYREDFDDDDDDTGQGIYDEEQEPENNI